MFTFHALVKLNISIPCFRTANVCAKNPKKLTIEDQYQRLPGKQDICFEIEIFGSTIRSGIILSSEVSMRIFFVEVSTHMKMSNYT